MLLEGEIAVITGAASEDGFLILDIKQVKLFHVRR